MGKLLHRLLSHRLAIDQQLDRRRVGERPDVDLIAAGLLDFLLPRKSLARPVAYAIHSNEKADSIAD